MTTLQIAAMTRGRALNDMILQLYSVRKDRLRIRKLGGLSDGTIRMAGGAKLGMSLTTAERLLAPMGYRLVIVPYATPEGQPVP